jgi:prepilin-type N-terminal cleavage/methylation domain-containing protein
MKKQDGFTLIELIITMAVFVLSMAAASNIFTGLLTQYKQQSKIAETNIEGVIGLEMLRHDIEQAGFGLPWDLNGIGYNEAINDGTTTQDETSYNDGGNPPRSFVLGDAEGWINGTLNTDVLVIKATTVATNEASQKWTYNSNVGANNIIPVWRNAVGGAIPSENLNNGDRITVLSPVSGGGQRVMVSAAATFFTQFNTDWTNGTWDNFEPTANSFNTRLVYGISSNVDPRMPFNRADYYVRQPGTLPDRCDPNNTGVLYKATVNHADGLLSELPLLDCVADLQVVFGRDTNGDGEANSYGTTPGADADDIRDELLEIRVYVLAHEGQVDSTFTSPATITAFDPGIGANVINWAVPANARNYRWRVYTIITRPYNLMS